MRGAVELSAFAGLALALHVAVWAGLSGGGAPSAGDGGGDAVTLQAADPGLVALVAEWDRQPEVMVAPAEAPAAPPTGKALPVPRAEPMANRPPSQSPEAPRAPAPAMVPPEVPAPDMVPDRPFISFSTGADASDPGGAVPSARPGAAPDNGPSEDRSALLADPLRALPAEPVLDQLAETDPLGTADPAPAPQAQIADEEAPRPTPRPSAAPADAPDTPRRQAAGRGDRAAEGRAGSAEAALSEQARATLMGEWGGRIRAQIMRGSPRAPVAGVVTLRLDIARDGTLHGVDLTRSSGHPALDRAALGAVRAAGRFPPAPAALGGAMHRFTLPLRFD